MRNPQNRPAYAYRRAFRTEGNITYLSTQPRPERPRAPQGQYRQDIWDSFPHLCRAALPSFLESLSKLECAVLRKGLNAVLDNANTDAEFEAAQGLYSAVDRHEACLSSSAPVDQMMGVHPYHETQE